MLKKLVLMSFVTYNDTNMKKSNAASSEIQFEHQAQVSILDDIDVI